MAHFALRLRELGATHVLDRAGAGDGGVVAGYPSADFGMQLLAAFQRSLSFATFSSDTVPAG